MMNKIISASTSSDLPFTIYHFKDLFTPQDGVSGRAIARLQNRPKILTI